MSMILTGRTANRGISIILYFGLCLLVLKGGFVLINYSVDSKFYNDFLVPWKIAAESYTSRAGDWSGFTGSNHLPYMDKLVQSMHHHDIHPPESNTGRRFIYRIKKIDFQSRDYNIFLLCRNHHIVIYGLPEKTWLRVDRFIDDQQDWNSGHFTGTFIEKDDTCTGVWQL